MYLQKGQNKDDKIEKKRLVSEILANTFTGFVFKHPVIAGVTNRKLL